MTKRLACGFALLIALAAWPSTAAAQTTQATLSSITCPGSGCLDLTVSATGQIAVQINSGFDATWVLEKTADNVVWQAWTLTSTSGAAVTYGYQPGLFTGATDGSAKYRVRFSNYFSGSSLTTINFIDASELPKCALNESVIYNGTAWGCFTPPNTASTYSNPSWISTLAWSKITGTPTSLAGYGIIDAQPLDADLTAIAALTTTAFGRGFLPLADAAAARTYINAGMGSPMRSRSIPI
jgi:hypothetical protein